MLVQFWSSYNQWFTNKNYQKLIIWANFSVSSKNKTENDQGILGGIPLNQPAVNGRKKFTQQKMSAEKKRKYIYIYTMSPKNHE